MDAGGEHIRLLDCTLRDGGHIMQGRFGENVIRNTLEYLTQAGVDIIEAGFLWETPCDSDSARYYAIRDLKRVLPENRGKSKFALMADFIDLEHLEPYDGTVEYIRLSFKRWRLDWGLKTARILMDKGYKVFINPVNNNVYSDRDYIAVLDKVNELHPYGFSIVDTFGVMRVNELAHRYLLVEHNLRPDITIGLHLHENLGLANSLAQHFIRIASPKRKVVIDGSLLGMGRVPGNLCIEQIADYINDSFGSRYELEPIYDAIDDYIAPLKRKYPWGYALPYALSAKYYLHRTYAEYLMDKQRLKTKDIQRILSKVAPSEAETFNESYIRQLYHDYMDVKYDDAAEMRRLKESLSRYQDIVIISPGASIRTAWKRIRAHIHEKTCVISVNFIPVSDGIRVDYVFLTNMKRYEQIRRENRGSALIITSNLLRSLTEKHITIEYHRLAYFNNEEYCDDSTLMLLNLLHKLNVRQAFVAGFDGMKNGGFQYYDTFFSPGGAKKNSAYKIRGILRAAFPHMQISLITESEYSNKTGENDEINSAAELD